MDFGSTSLSPISRCRTFHCDCILEHRAEIYVTSKKTSLSFVCMALYQTSLLSRTRSLSPLINFAAQDIAFARIIGQQSRVKNARFHAHNQSSQLPRAQCSAPNGVTGKVCNRVDSVRLQMVPQDIQIKVKNLILDGVACMMIGAKLPWSEKATQAVVDIEGYGDCTLFGRD